jgi:hypothetical protein
VRIPTAGALALAAATTAALMSTSSAEAATFTVGNTSDAGAGSLRQAIIDLNNGGAGPHTIRFTVAGTITPATPLDRITKRVTMDGNGDIVLDVSNVARGLALETSGSTVRGLEIDAATDDGVRVHGDGNRVQGNVIGVGGANGDDGLYVEATTTSSAARGQTTPT